MTKKRIVFTRPDGGVSIVVPTPEKMAQFKTEADGLNAVRQNNVPSDATDVQIAERSDLPADRTYRDAWERDTSRPKSPIKTDMPKAKEIHMARIREACRTRAKDLVEREMLGEDITIEKTALQAVDAQALVASAKTVEELKVVWPAELAKV